MLKVKGSKGLLVREGRALTSPERATLACGALVHVVETRATVLGDARCRLASGGWCSRKLLEPAEDAEAPAATPPGGVPAGAGAAVDGAHGDAQVDDCACFEGLVVSGGWDGAVRVADGDAVETLRHETRAWAYSVDAFRDGRGALAIISGHTGGMTGDSESNLRLWRVAGRGAKRRWEAACLGGHTRGCHAVCGGGGRACSASSDLLQLWAVGDEIKSTASVAKPSGGDVNALLLDGDALVSGSTHPSLKIWDLATLACARAEDGMGPVEAVARWDRDVYAVASHTGCFLWDARASMARVSEKAHVCWGAAVSRGLVCYGGAGDGLVFHDVAAGKPRETKDAGFLVKCVGFDASSCVCGSGAGTLRVWAS